jgi:MFS family permease
VRFTGLWRNSDFLKLWAGETVSIFGSLIGGAALPFTAILTLHAGPGEMALLTAAGRVPALIGGLLAGAWVDRLRRRPILIATDAGRALLLGSSPLAWALGALRIEHLYAVAFMIGILTVLFDVAYLSYLPTLVRRDELMEGNSKLAASASAAEFGGFGIGGWLVQIFSGPVAILIDALTFVWSAVFISRIRAEEPPPTPAHERQHIRREIADGLRTVYGSPVLRAIAGAQILRELSMGIMSVLVILYVTRDLGFSPGVQGLIYAVGGLTSLAGATVAGRVTARLGTGRTMILCLAVSGLGTLCLPLAHGAGPAAVLLLIANQLITDPAWTIYEVTEVSLRQSVAPKRLLGRVNASIRFAGLAATLTGAAVAGILGGMIGARPTMLLGIGATLLAALWLLRSPVRRLREAPETIADAAEALTIPT